MYVQHARTCSEHWGLEFRAKLFKLLKNKTGKNLCDGVARLTNNLCFFCKNTLITACSLSYLESDGERATLGNMVRLQFLKTKKKTIHSERFYVRYHYIHIPASLFSSGLNDCFPKSQLFSGLIVCFIYKCNFIIKNLETRRGVPPRHISHWEVTQCAILSFRNLCHRSNN